MKTLDILIDYKNYDINMIAVKRVTARAIIRKNNEYLWIHSKFQDYQFPGGGKDNEETLEETLYREVLEETGYHVIKNSIKKYGQVLEKRKGMYDDHFEMESHYFFCDVTNEISSTKPNDIEKDYDYQAIWLTIEEVLKRNKNVIDYQKCPWLKRDTKVMESLLVDYLLLNIPTYMKSYLDNMNYKIDSVGCTNAFIFMFENDMVLKVEKVNPEALNGYIMMKWLQGKVTVPKIISYAIVNDYQYLLMSKLKGKMAIDDTMLANPKKLGYLLARGIKKLNAVNISDCPHLNNLDFKLARALENINNQLININDAEIDTYGENGFKNPMELFNYLNENRPLEEYRLIHGDYCLPNIFLDQIDQFDNIAFLDLGFCGIGDYYQDIALAVRSLKHNYEAIGEDQYQLAYDEFFKELGIIPDLEKIKYYTLLDELF